MNARVNKKLKFLEDEKKRAAQDQMLKSLTTLEKEAEEVLQQEVIVIMGKDMLNKLKEVFDSCKERGQEHIDEVNTSDLIGEILSDPEMEKYLEQEVRESVDGVKETLH